MDLELSTLNHSRFEMNMARYFLQIAKAKARKAHKAKDYKAWAGYMAQCRTRKNSLKRLAHNTHCELWRAGLTKVEPTSMLKIR